MIVARAHPAPLSPGSTRGGPVLVPSKQQQRDLVASRNAALEKRHRAWLSKDPVEALDDLPALVPASGGSSRERGYNREKS